jgi:hypothetical protein
MQVASAMRRNRPAATDCDENLAKSRKKESKILQNEATKPNRIIKSTRKIGQNEAKRSEIGQSADRAKSFGISQPV